ncbi:MAG: hypothetical protein LC754_09620 [Acidobacteria bacterium]|nr:hypothetical protein [Acidobacteriota bacterium]
MLKKIACLLLIFLCASLARPHSSSQHGDARAAQHKASVSLQASRRDARPLWPGARFNGDDRRRAIYRGMRFIYRGAREPENFKEYGEDLVWWFGVTSGVMRDPALRRMARRMGVELALRWRREHRTVPRGADADTIAELVSGDNAASSLGVRAARLKEQLRFAASRFSAREYLKFDPLTEPPPNDVPEECEYDQTENPRGATVCAVCHRPLAMKSRYDVWYDALITAYIGERARIKLGASYADVLKWLPSLRPYRGREQDANTDFIDSVYAATHVVYTLNDYSRYRLSPRWLPQEYEFLRSSVKEAVAIGDTDMLGELLDSLKSFGLTDADAEVRAGTEFLLARQNLDGSWGDVDEDDFYDRYHPTETAIDGLSDYAWQGERINFPQLKPVLEKWAAGHEATTTP